MLMWICLYITVTSAHNACLNTHISGLQGRHQTYWSDQSDTHSVSLHASNNKISLTRPPPSPSSPLPILTPLIFVTLSFSLSHRPRSDFPIFLTPVTHLKPHSFFSLKLTLQLHVALLKMILTDEHLPKTKSKTFTLVILSHCQDFKNVLSTYYYVNFLWKKKLDKTLKNKEVKEDREMGGSYLQSPWRLFVYSLQTPQTCQWFLQHTLELHWPSRRKKDNKLHVKSCLDSWRWILEMNPCVNAKWSQDGFPLVLLNCQPCQTSRSLIW